MRIAAPGQASGVAAVLALLFALSIVLQAPPAVSREAPPTFAELAERLLPSVVNISTTQVVPRQRRRDTPQAPPGSPFEEFFREFFERNPRGDAPLRATSLGSGFIIGSGGLVVTNNRVIAEADEITVILADNTRHEAEILGRDPKTDLALLKINAGRELPAVQWGDSAEARVGEWVLAIGNPFGFGSSATAGIISAVQRDINVGPYDSFIQTDASINHGSSGGPLFNMDGQVIGVNTVIFSPTGGSVGIGFSIPSSIAQRVVAQLREFGRTKRGWLGVRVQTVTEEIAEGLGFDGARGALVASVTSGGPAEEANIMAGDIILSFAGHEIQQMRELSRIVAETEIGREVDVEVWRKGRHEVLRVRVGELEEANLLASTAPPGGLDERRTATIDALGLSLTTVTDEVREEFGLEEDTNGVLVMSVDVGSGAAEGGLRRGDVILEVDQEEVTTPAQAAARVKEAQDLDRRSVLLLVNRGGERRFVAVRINTE